MSYISIEFDNWVFGTKGSSSRNTTYENG